MSKSKSLNQKQKLKKKISPNLNRNKNPLMRLCSNMQKYQEKRKENPIFI
jgi:hypothetical protein